MNRAVFYRGLAFEHKVLSHDSQMVLTYDGQPVDAQPDETESEEFKRYHKEDGPYREIIERVIHKKGNEELKEVIEKREIIKKEHEKILLLGVSVWNKWRKDNPKIRPLLYDTDLSGNDLTGANFSNANLIDAILKEEESILEGANFHEANLGGANLSYAKLKGANFCRTDLYKTNLSGAKLIDVNLQGTQLAMTNFQGATLEKCKIFGIAAWDLEFDDDTTQHDLIITTKDGKKITVDQLELAQFIYLLLNNQKMGEFINTIGRKLVLILGCFCDKRKAVLDAIRERLRDLDLVPMLFDWDKPSRRDLTETVLVLANLSRFVVADLTDAKSIPQELSHIVPFMPSVPVRPIILTGEKEYSMFEHWSGSPTMLPIFRYNDKDHLIGNIETELLDLIKKWEAGYDKTKALEEANRVKDEEISKLRAQIAALNGADA